MLQNRYEKYYSSEEQQYNALGNYIRVLREKYKIQQQVLAQASDILPHRLCEYEKGVHVPNSVNLNKIARGFRLLDVPKHEYLKLKEYHELSTAARGTAVASHVYVQNPSNMMKLI